MSEDRTMTTTERGTGAEERAVVLRELVATVLVRSYTRDDRRAPSGVDSEAADKVLAAIPGLLAQHAERERELVGALLKTSVWFDPETVLGREIRTALSRAGATP